MVSLLQAALTSLWEGSRVATKSTEISYNEVSRHRVIHSIFMPDIAEYLEDAGQEGHPSIICKCPGCSRNLDISTCMKQALQWECDNAGSPHSSQSTEKFYRKHNLENALLLKCGHLVGKQCFRQRLEAMVRKKRSEIEQEGLCFSCRENIFCDGCGSRLLVDPSYDPLTVKISECGLRADNFPVKPGAKVWHHYAHRENSRKLTLTSAEQDPHAKRYCVECVNMNNLRMMADIWLARPTEEHEDSNDFRRGLRSTAKEISQTVYPSMADVRDRMQAPWLDYEVDTKCRNFVEALVSSKAFGQIYDKALGYEACHELGKAHWYKKSEQPPDVRYLQSKEQETKGAPISLEEIRSVLRVSVEEALKCEEYMLSKLPLSWYRMRDEEGQNGLRLQAPGEETPKVEEIIEVEEVIEADEAMEVDAATEIEEVVEVDETAEIKEIMEIIKDMGLEDVIKLGEATEVGAASDMDKTTETSVTMALIKSMGSEEVIKAEEATGAVGRPRLRPVLTKPQRILAALVRAPSFDQVKPLVNPRVLKAIDMDALVHRVYKSLISFSHMYEGPQRDALVPWAPKGATSNGEKAGSSQWTNPLRRIGYDSF